MVVDTSIFIEFLRAKDKTKTVLFQISDDEQIYISSVTLYELLMGAYTPIKVNDIKILTEDIPVLPFNEDVATKPSKNYNQMTEDEAFYTANNNQIIEDDINEDQIWSNYL
ncbi:MAG: type II toxin-antitoxin system VapC family toxin [Bacteroidales bacterium]|nr:type II toxin-antitoxin system VapC family toxin [Bacteroidales bacterium]